MLTQSSDIRHRTIAVKALRCVAILFTDPINYESNIKNFSSSVDKLIPLLCQVCKTKGSPQDTDFLMAVLQTILIVIEPRNRTYDIFIKANGLSIVFAVMTASNKKTSPLLIIRCGEIIAFTVRSIEQVVKSQLYKIFIYFIN